MIDNITCSVTVKSKEREQNDGLVLLAGRWNAGIDVRVSRIAQISVDHIRSSELGVVSKEGSIANPTVVERSVEYR
jgi:hypothetical protein